jgi:crotonobetainyl-CoA:carnitine CoA-transferase CaiB-like acyl-CoA transferase
MQQSIHTQFFKDIVVLELASVLAGPSVGRFFAECGARVIKVEHPLGGDVTRSWKVVGETDGISAYYASVNAGKEVIRLDLKNAADQLVLKDLILHSDILLSNFRDDSAKKLGLSLDELRVAYPNLIIGQVDAFNSESKRPAYDIVLQAEAGYLSMCGSKNEPARLPVAFIDILAGHQLKEGILMAMLHKSKGNSGCIVRVNLLDVAIGSLMNQASNYLMANYLAKPMGTLHPNIAPYGECFGCADDKQLVLAIGNDSQFEKMVQLLGMIDLLKDTRFQNNAMRVQNRKMLWEILAPAFALKKRSEWMEAFELHQIPAGAILNLQEVLEGSGKTLVTESEIEGFTVRSVQTVNLNMF